MTRLDDLNSTSIKINSEKFPQLKSTTDRYDNDKEWNHGNLQFK